MRHYGYGRKAREVVGYAYAAETLCPWCTLQALAGVFPGRSDHAGRGAAEDYLTELAATLSIDRQDERSFDSGDFPKVIFASDSDGDTCDACGAEL